jgi:hypothetical protein
MFRHRIKDLMILNAGVAILFGLSIVLSGFISRPLVAIVVVMPVLTMVFIGSLVWVEAYLCRKKMKEALQRGDVRPLAWVQAYLSCKKRDAINRFRRR